MRDIAETLQAWLDAGEDVAFATVVEVTGSVPRPLGTTMAITSGGRVAGNVSAGCVESAVVEQAVHVLDGGDAGVSRFGISDEQALSVGLTCGGGIGVLVARLTPTDVAAVDAIAAAVAAGDPVAGIVVTAGPARVGALLAVTPEATVGSLGENGLDAAAAADARGMLTLGETGIRHYGSEGGRRLDEVAVLVQAHAPAPRFLIFGAIDFAAALSELATFLGYRVTVCDARAAFATRERFPSVSDIVVEWPHRYLERTGVDSSTVICVLTHDPKFDVPLLLCALQTPAAYVGVMGSRRSQEDRLQRLRDAGVPPHDLERLRAPLGLDLGARTPAETAVSIAAEVVALRWGGTGRPLTDVRGAIHGEPVA